MGSKNVLKILKKEISGRMSSKKSKAASKSQQLEEELRSCHERLKSLLTEMEKRQNR